jgi:Bacterial aa3 type cytochrome c oxidase subunit IV
MQGRRLGRRARYGMKPMHVNLADANEGMDMEAHLQTCRKFVSPVNYFIGSAVFQLICMTIFLT